MHLTPNLFSTETSSFHLLGLIPAKPLVLKQSLIFSAQSLGHMGAIWRDGLGAIDQRDKAWQDADVVLVVVTGQQGGAIKAELNKRSSSYSRVGLYSC